MQTQEIGLAALVATLLLVGEHYFPWRPLLGRYLKLHERYVLGVLALYLPLSALFAWWQNWQALIAIWSVAASGGLTVLAVFALDAWFALRSRAEVAERQADTLIDEVERHAPLDE